MKRILQMGFLTLSMVLVTSFSAAGVSKSASFRMSATLPQHPAIIQNADIQTSQILELNTPYLMQETEDYRYDQLVLVQSFTIK